MGEKMSPNDVEKNGGKIEEYMVRAENSSIAPMHGVFQIFGGSEGQPAFIQARFDVFQVTFQSGS